MGTSCGGEQWQDSGTLSVALAAPMLLIPGGYQVVELKCMVFTGLADSETVATHAAKIHVFVISLGC